LGEVVEGVLPWRKKVRDGLESIGGESLPLGDISAREREGECIAGDGWKFSLDPLISSYALDFLRA
jgi:hypothetical protein